MKNVFLTLLVIVLMTITATAQLALEGGYNMPSLSITTYGTKLATTAKKGANFGLLGDISVDEHKHLYFEPGLYYENAGCKFSGLPDDYYDINIIDLHLNLEYKFGERCGSRFMFGGGPYIGYNMSGGYSLSKNGKIPATSGDLKIGPDVYDDLKNRGLGFGVNLGYKMKKHLYFRAYYMQGLSNIKAFGDPDNRIKTSALGINIGYLFANCKPKRDYVSTAHEGKPNHWRGLSKGKYSRRLKYGLRNQ